MALIVSPVINWERKLQGHIEEVTKTVKTPDAVSKLLDLKAVLLLIHTLFAVVIHALKIRSSFCFKVTEILKCSNDEKKKIELRILGCNLGNRGN